MQDDGRTRSRFADLWLLDPDVAYLNHGSFGACPRAILDYQSELRRELEREPTDFMWRHWQRRIDAAREALASFVNASADDLAFVSNATSGASTVARSLPLEPGDEILTTDHAYGACRKAFEHVARARQARVAVAKVPFPLASGDEITGAIVEAVTPRTRFALIDHVTSPTGLVFPVAQIVAALRERGIETLVDGADALGMLPLDLDGIGAAFYTANAHKGLCAPKGSALLHVRRDFQTEVHPLSISHGYDPEREGSSFREEFDWTGTLDPTPWLVVPECIRFLGELLPGGWPELMQTNHALAVRARAILCKLLGAGEPAPAELIGSLASIPLPPAAAGAPAADLDHKGLMHWTREHGVESWFFPWPCEGGRLVRASAQVYNDAGQYRRLAVLLGEALGV